MRAAKTTSRSLEADDCCNKALLSQHLKPVQQSGAQAASKCWMYMYCVGEDADDSLTARRGLAADTIAQAHVHTNTRSALNKPASEGATIACRPKQDRQQTVPHTHIHTLTHICAATRLRSCSHAQSAAHCDCGRVPLATGGGGTVKHPPDNRTSSSNSWATVILTGTWGADEDRSERERC